MLAAYCLHPTTNYPSLPCSFSPSLPYLRRVSYGVRSTCDLMMWDEVGGRDRTKRSSHGSRGQGSGSVSQGKNGQSLCGVYLHVPTYGYPASYLSSHLPLPTSEWLSVRSTEYILTYLGTFIHTRGSLPKHLEPYSFPSCRVLSCAVLCCSFHPVSSGLVWKSCNFACPPFGPMQPPSTTL